jgi:hypothetical protein
MLEDQDNTAGSVSSDEGFDLLQELTRNTPEEISRQRAHFRLAIKAGVTMQSGNTSDLRKFKVKGVTGDVSEGGLSALFPIPTQVGDIYRLQFDREVLELPLTFARCVRCRVIREDAYEAGFAFFTPICLPENVRANESSLIS